MKIAIIGCGIGGLAIANFLAKANYSVEVFDQFSAPAPVGSGLVIQPVGQAVLAELGVLEAALSKGARGYTMLGLEADNQRKVLDVSYGKRDGESFGLGIHRASLFDVLLNAAEQQNIPIQSGSKVTSTTLEGESRFIRVNHSEQLGPFDLVIDASGASSQISPLKARELPYGAVWTSVDWPAATSLRYDQLEQRYRKAKNMIGVLPIGSMPAQTQAKAALFWSLPANQYEAWCNTPIETWQQQAIALWPEAEPFVQQVTQHAQMSMARYSHGQLAKPYGERLVFIGDSAHRASPQLGQGANMALLDAHALALALAKHPLNQALPAYARARKLHTRIYQTMSWAFTPMYQSNSSVLPLLRDYLLAPLSQVPPVPAILTSLVKGTMVAAVKGL